MKILILLVFLRRYMHSYYMRVGDNLKKYWGVYIYTLFFVAVVLWGIALQFLPEKETPLNYYYNIAMGLVYLFGGVVGYVYGRCKMAPSHLLKALKLIVVAQFMYAVACFIWGYYNIVLHVAVPFPSVADIFYLLYILILALAMWQLLLLADVPITQTNIRDSAIIISVSYVAIFYMFSIIPVNIERTYIEMMSNLLYPVIDIFVISIAFMVLQFGTIKVKRSMLLILLSVFLQMVGDFYFTYKEMNGLYWNGGFADVLFVASGFILSFALVTFSTCPFTGKDVKYD